MPLLLLVSSCLFELGTLQFVDALPIHDTSVAATYDTYSDSSHRVLNMLYPPRVGVIDIDPIESQWLAKAMASLGTSTKFQQCSVHRSKA
jgi:hypothetical protein